MIDAAIKDVPPYSNFSTSLQKINAAVSSRHP